MKTKQKFKIKERGITLIALVITIIILLILAAVTIAALSGDNGILSNAARAKQETERAEILEQIRLDIYGEMADNEGTDPTEADIERIADNYGDISGSTFDDKVLKTEKGSYEIKLSDIWQPEKADEGVTIPEGLEIGSYVSYNPSGTYPWYSEYCSSPEDTSYEKTLDSSTGQPFNIDTWRVFDINEETGEVTLVPEHSTDDGNDGASATSGTVYLKGAQGYNNGVKLLNDACSALYGNEAKGIKARSINIEDIEGKMIDTELAKVYEENGYGEQVSTAYTEGNSYYPSIYAKELFRSLNGENRIETGLGMSEQAGDFIEATDDDATEGYLQGAGLRPTETYWYGDNSFMQTAFETANSGVNYYDLLMPDGNNTYYWVASRYVNTNSSDCGFDVRHVDSGGMNANYMFDSTGNRNNGYYGLFPVVSLSSELIEGNATDGFAVQ
mgnify:CR=1 FL=1